MNGAIMSCRQSKKWAEAVCSLMVLVGMEGVHCSDFRALCIQSHWNDGNKGWWNVLKTLLFPLQKQSETLGCLDLLVTFSYCRGVEWFLKFETTKCQSELWLSSGVAKASSARACWTPSNQQTSVSTASSQLMWLEEHPIHEIWGGPKMLGSGSWELLATIHEAAAVLVSSCPPGWMECSTERLCQSLEPRYGTASADIKASPPQFPMSMCCLLVFRYASPNFLMKSRCRCMLHILWFFMKLYIWSCYDQPMSFVPLFAEDVACWSWDRSRWNRPSWPL